MGFSEASVFSKVGLVLSCVAFIFDIIGFPSPYWISINLGTFKGNQGLFQYCVGGTCSDVPVSLDWQDAAKALNIIGFLLGVACMIIVIIYVAVKNDNKMLQLVGSVLGLAAGLFIVIGSAVYGAKTTETGLSADVLSWSFALTIVGGVLYLAAGVVLLVEKFMAG